MSTVPSKVKMPPAATLRRCTALLDYCVAKNTPDVLLDRRDFYNLVQMATALGFYADRANYEPSIVVGTIGIAIRSDRGTIARKALGVPSDD